VSDVVLRVGTVFRFAGPAGASHPEEVVHDEEYVITSISSPQQGDPGRTVSISLDDEREATIWAMRVATVRQRRDEWQQRLDAIEAAP
jgi:hypothetical protein